MYDVGLIIDIFKQIDSSIDKIAGKSFLSKYGEIDWKGVKGMRDIITHYFDIDAEAIFEVCKTHIPVLKKVVCQILSNLGAKTE